MDHNWRELQSDKGWHKGWIPVARADTWKPHIEVMSRDPRHLDFLRPAKDSPLATAGAGAADGLARTLAAAVGLAHGPTAGLATWTTANRGSAFDPSLPAYVGAVPPKGMQPWDWEKTWKALAR
jgi:hypothetical protein